MELKTIHDLNGKHLAENVYKVGDKYEVDINTTARRIEITNLYARRERYVIEGKDAESAMKEILDMANNDPYGLEHALSEWLVYSY